MELVRAAAQWEYAEFWWSGWGDGLNCVQFSSGKPVENVTTDEFWVVMRRLGLQGWEMVSANSPGCTTVTSFMFKRRITVGTRDHEGNRTDPAQYLQTTEDATPRHDGEAPPLRVHTG